MTADVLCLRPEADFTRAGVTPPAQLAIAYRKPDDPQLAMLIKEARALVIPAVGGKISPALFENSTGQLNPLAPVKDFEWDVFPIPRVSKSGPPPVTYTSGDPNCVNAKSDKKDEAWLFVKWLAGPTVQNLIGRTKLLTPALIEATADAKGYAAPPPAHIKVFADVFKGKVTRLAEFGAFVELEPAVEGLIHISELAPQRVHRVGDIVKVGQEVQVMILRIDKEQRRISLSLKAALALTAAPAEEEEEEDEEPVEVKPPRPRTTPLRGGLGDQ